MRANNDKQNVAAAKRFGDVRPKIDSEGDAVQVHENLVSSEYSLESIVNATGDRGAIFSSIRNRNHLC